MFKLPVLYLLICLPGVKFQACDRSSETTQCSEGEICRDSTCQTATQCQSTSWCGRPGDGCITDYCQPYSCTTTGQCVHGQRCSHDSIRQCVYFRHIVAEEGSQVGLPIAEPAVTGSYEEIWWYHGCVYATTTTHIRGWYRHERGERRNRIVLLHPSLTKGRPLYSPEYCSQATSCHESDKVSLNTQTGELTIYNVSLTDDDYYSYQFYAPVSDGASDTGYKYEIFLEVYVVPVPKIIVSTDYVTPGDLVRLECATNRIKPEARDIYWTINGRKVTGNNSTWTNEDGRTFRQISYITKTFSLEELAEAVKCTVVPKYGSSVTAEIALRYAPHGSPTISPELQKKYALQQVVLTCNTNTIAVGNPPCQTFTWRKIDGTMENIIKGRNRLEFIMEEQDGGNYTCKCGNQFGETDFSQPSELVFMSGTPPGESASSTKIFIIAGSIGGILLVVFIFIVIAAVVVRKRYICIRKETELPPASTRSESLYYIHAHDPYIQRYETPETRLEEDNIDNGYLKPQTPNTPVQKIPRDRTKHIYENEESFVSQRKNNYVNLEPARKQTENKSIEEVKANNGVHHYFQPCEKILKK